MGHDTAVKACHARTLVSQMHAKCRYSVALPGKQQGWRWGFHSCNGLSAGADLREWKDPHLWEDVMAVHREKPIHAFVGGGDQLYNDALWQTPSMHAWVSGTGIEVGHTLSPAQHLTKCHVCSDTISQALSHTRRQCTPDCFAWGIA